MQHYVVMVIVNFRMKNNREFFWGYIEKGWGYLSPHIMEDCLWPFNDFEAKKV